MAGKSDYLENELLDHVLGGGDYTRPATVYIALFTVVPNDAGALGTEVPSSNNYSRVSVTNNNTNWPAAAGGVKSNGTSITFPTASGSWGTIVGLGIYDAATLGNLLFFGSLSTAKVIGNTDVFSVAAGNLTISED